MQIEIKDPITHFPDDYFTKVVSMGNITELVMMDKHNNQANIKKLDSDHYVDLKTGEIKEFAHWDDRADGLGSVRKTLENLRNIINANVSSPENCKFVTLTYRDNMTDVQQLYSDRQNYWLKFKRYCKKKGIPVPEYISVVEPQGRGAWHLHDILIWASKAPFIPANDIWYLWSKDGCLQREIDGVGYDFVKVQAVTDCDNVGAYFSAYLADMPLDEAESIGLFREGLEVNEKEFHDIDGNKKIKKFVKGGRLRLYPSGMNIYRRSKGVKDPTIEYMQYSRAKEKVSAATETFSRTIVLTDSLNGFENTITKRYYNISR